MSGVTYIYNNGQYAGMYDHVKGVCVAAQEQENKPATKTAAPSYQTNLKAEQSWWKNILFGARSNRNGHISCGEAPATAVSNQLGDGGIDMEQPGGDADGGTAGDGGTVSGDNEAITLPVDENGSIILPDAAFLKEISGTGSFFQETPDITLQSGLIGSVDLANEEHVYIELGTDTTKLIAVDSNADGIPDALVPDCWNGLISTNQLSPEDIANGEIGCPDEGYQTFVACPGDEVNGVATNRLNVYVAGYTIQNYEFNGMDANNQPIYEALPGQTITRTLTNTEDLFLSTDDGQKLPPVCGENPAPYQTEKIPQDWYSDTTLYVKITFNLIVDARGKVPTHTFKTILSGKIKKQ